MSENILNGYLSGGFKYFCMFTPKIGEDEPILTIIFFQMGLVQPPTRYTWGILDPENIRGVMMSCGHLTNDWCLGPILYLQVATLC